MQREERRFFECLSAGKRKRRVEFLHGNERVVFSFESDTADVVRHKNLPRVEQPRELLCVTDYNLTITIKIRSDVGV